MKRSEGSAFTEDLLEKELSGQPLSSSDRGLCQELVYGVVRREATLDWLIDRKTRGRSQRTALRIVLELGLYQMFWLDRIPSHAAVNESVEIAKRMGLVAQSGFVNAVLRGYDRERDETLALLANIKADEPALGHSHPEWLWERWQKRLGPLNAAKLMEWNNSPASTFARVNTLRTDARGLRERWQQEGVTFKEFSSDWTGPDLVFELERHPPLGTLKSFVDGLFYIQDPSTLLAVRALDPKPGDQILDLCAAPGGKTTFIAQCLQNQGSVVAEDNEPERLKLVAENCSRMGITCVTTQPSLGGHTPEGKPVLFKSILVDAPCSNTGVMRRRVDLRWRISEEEISRLRHTQLGLLEQAARRLQTGGTLVYSTCSLEPVENEEVIKAFLAAHPDFTLVQERELLPFREGVDGAYVAKLIHNWRPHGL